MPTNRRRGRRKGGGKWQIERERCRISDWKPPHAFREAEPVDGALMRVMGGLGIREESFGTDVAERWTEVVTGPIAQHTRPGGLDGTRLVVFVDSSVWLSELSRFGKKKLLEKIQKVWGADRIQDITLRMDPGER